MAKLVGSTKTGGRKKGTPNKRTLAFSEVLESENIDLLMEVLRSARSLSEKDRINVYLTLLPYQYPKRKPTEHQVLALQDLADS